MCAAGTVAWWGPPLSCVEFGETCGKLHRRRAHAVLTPGQLFNHKLHLYHLGVQAWKRGEDIE